MKQLTLFDLDHTLLAGDSDVLWCEFLMARGVLDRAGFGPRNAQMEAGYRAGTVSAQHFAGFYVGTLEGRMPGELEPLRRDFLAREIIPRIPTAATQLVQRHLREDDLVVLTTATNRFITELTSHHLAIPDLIATEVEVANGRFTGRTQGMLNMREGKVLRLKQWAQQHGLVMDEWRTTAYSDSINDLPLLEFVDEPVAVDPDAQLAAIALSRGWPVLHLHR